MLKPKIFLRELCGAFGDLGTFVPIFIALVAVNGLNPTAILVTSGILYVCCGIYYGLPIPVQPLKAMAAIAITLGLGKDYIQAAGIIIGLFLLLISFVNLTKFLPRIFTLPIVKGMQLGVGLMLIKTSLVMVSRGDSLQNILAIDSIQLFQLGKLNFFLPSFDLFFRAFWLLALPQLPLTLGNAVVGTCDVARKHFGIRARKVNERSLCLGLGMINVLSGLISGNMPLCHGSSGLTAHISFGARTGRATVITGVLFLLFGFILGKEAAGIFKMIPHNVLGYMLFYVGFKHAMNIADLKGKAGFLLALGIGLIGLFTDNLTLALCTGVLFWHFPKFVRGFLKAGKGTCNFLLAKKYFW